MPVHALFAIAFLTLATPARSGYVCSETVSGGSCYGYLGGPHSARFQSYDWGHEIFPATFAGQSFHCAAVGREVFARAAATSDYMVVSWDQTHRCTAIDFTPRG